MKPLDPAALAAVTGGLNLEHSRESTNVEDRRGEDPRVWRKKRRG